MKCKLSIVVDNRMSGICSSLKADDDIGLLCEHVRNLTFSLISPVSTYYCFYHNISSCM